MLTYAHVCCRMLTYADVCGRMLTDADVCCAVAAFEALRKPLGECIKLIAEADYPERTPTLLSSIGDCCRMLTYADVC